MIDPHNLATILAMAAVTYLTRVLGYLAFRNRALSERARAVCCLCFQGNRATTRGLGHSKRSSFM